MRSRRGWQSVVGLVVIFVVIAVFGASPFIDAFASVTPTAVVLALFWGLIPVLSHAQRWRQVASAYQASPKSATAIAGIYQSSFLNMVLPGGVAGDVVRAIDHPVGSKPRGGSGPRVVAAERLLGTVVTVLGAGTALALMGLPGQWWLWFPVAALSVLLLLGVWWLAAKELRWPQLIGALAWSLVMWASLLAMTLYAAQLALPALPLTTAAALGAVCLAAMAVPTSIGGWGPREGLTALTAGLWGLAPADGVTLAATFGVLALISTLPGALFVVRSLLRPRQRPGTILGSKDHRRGKTVAPAGATHRPAAGSPGNANQEHHHQ